MFINEGASGSCKKNLMPTNKIDVRNPIKKIQNKNVKIQRSFFPELDTCFIAFSSITNEMEIKFSNALEYGYPIIIITDSDFEIDNIAAYIMLNKPNITFEIFNLGLRKISSEVLIITFKDFISNLNCIYRIDFKLYISTSIPQLGVRSNYIREMIKLRRQRNMN